MKEGKIEMGGFIYYGSNLRVAASNPFFNAKPNWGFSRLTQPIFLFLFLILYYFFLEEPIFSRAAQKIR